MKPGVFITFDVECSMGGAWGNPKLRPVGPSRTMMGHYGDKKLGLPLIIDILDRFKLTATFFVEVFGDELGYKSETEAVCKYLMDRGQDVQLHIHPGYMQYGLYKKGLPHPRTDCLADLSSADQFAILEKGVGRLTQWTGKMPVAFRAGNMAASEKVLEQMEKVDIKIDSSYTFPYAGGQCRFSSNNPFNGSRWYGNVLELALSGFYQPRLPGIQRAAPLDLMGISFEECRDAIRLICGGGADAVLILHSFSLFKKRNVQYDGGRINRIVTRRFRRLCEWLAAQTDEFPTYTFSELAKAIKNGQYKAKSVPPFRLPSRRVIVRKAVQAINNIYWV